MWAVRYQLAEKLQNFREHEKHEHYIIIIEKRKLANPVQEGKEIIVISICSSNYRLTA